jgi:hypothetical protein
MRVAVKTQWTNVLCAPKDGLSLSLSFSHTHNVMTIEVLALFLRGYEELPCMLFLPCVDSGSARQGTVLHYESGSLRIHQ